MSYIGDFRLGDTFDTKFTTRQISGAPFTLAGSPVISAYVGNNTTELTAGITLTVDFDSRTGLNNVRVVATGGNGYATASNYQLVITTGTVNSVSVVGEVVAEFSIENRSALMPTTAARTLDVSATGEGGVDWANVGSPTTTLALTGTTIASTQKVDIDTIKTNAVVNGGTITFPTNATLASTSNLASGTITTVSGNVNGSVGSVTGAVGSVTGNVGGNVVGSVASVTAAVTITSNIKKNQALAKYQFLMTDSTTHGPSTGLTVSVTRSIDGGAYAAGTLANVTEIGAGTYTVDFGAGDLNGNVIILKATAAASDTTFERIVTQP